MPIASIVVLTLLVYIFMSNKTYKEKYIFLFVLTCVLKIYWTQGYFLKIGNTEISSTSGVASYCLLIYSIYLFLCRKIEIKKRTCMFAVMLVVVSVISMIYEAVMPYEGMLMPEQNENSSWDLYVLGQCYMYPYTPSVSSYISSLITVIQFAVNVLLFKNICDKEMFLKSYMRIIYWLKFEMYFGIFEFFLKNIINDLTTTFQITEILFGLNASSVLDSAVMKGGIFYSLQGFAREPSHYNVFLFSLCLLMLLGNVMCSKFASDRIEKSYSKSTIFGCVVLLILSGGFSGVWFLTMLLVLALLLHIREHNYNVYDIVKKNKAWMMIFFVIAFVIGYVIMRNDYFSGRISDALAIVNFLGDTGSFVGASMLVDNEGAHSTLARFVSIYQGMVIFFDRPILGISFGVQTLHDFSIMYLVNMGVAGVFAMYKLLASTNNNLRYDNKFLFLLFIIGGFPMTVSCYGLSMHWLLFFEGTRLYMNKDW